MANIKGHFSFMDICSKGKDIGIFGNEYAMKNDYVGDLGLHINKKSPTEDSAGLTQIILP